MGAPRIVALGGHEFRSRPGEPAITRHLLELTAPCWPGQSAGAMCWFELGITASSGRPRPAAGLGLLPGSLSVHYGRDPERRETLLEEVGTDLAEGYALDDGAGLLFEATAPVEAFAGIRGARVVRLERDGSEVRELRIHPIPLRQELDPVDPAILERRALRRMKAAAR